MSTRILTKYRVFQIFSGLSFLMLSCCGLVSECPNYYNISASTEIDSFSLKAIDSSTLKEGYITNLGASKYDIISDFKAFGISSSLVSDIYAHGGGQMSLHFNALNYSGVVYHKIDFGIDSIIVNQSDAKMGAVTYNGKSFAGSITSNVPLTSRITDQLAFRYTIETSDTITGYLKFTVSGTISPEEETCQNYD